MAQTPKLKVTTPPGKEPPPMEVMAQSIVDIAAAAKALATTPLKRSTVIMLIAHSSKTPQRTVRSVLDAMVELEATYLKPRTPGGKQ